MIQLINPNTKVMKECPTGYSWTTFFFGIFVPLIRGDIKWAGILFALCAMVAVVTVGVGAGFVPPIFAFFYNKIFIKDMLEKGYVAADDFSQNYLVSNGYVVQPVTPPPAPVQTTEANNQ